MDYPSGTFGCELVLSLIMHMIHRSLYITTTRTYYVDLTGGVRPQGSLFLAEFP